MKVTSPDPSSGHFGSGAGMTQSGQQEVKEFGGEVSGKKGFLSLKKEAWEEKRPLLPADFAPC